MATEILVCVLCRLPNTPPETPRLGRALFEAVQSVSLDNEQPLAVRAVECMSGCKRACCVALQAPGKFTYFFGDLPADEATARQILACVRLHHESEDGFLPRETRPARLREGILARLPPLLKPPVAVGG